ALIAHGARLGNQTFHQHPPEPEAAILRPYVKPLHLADAGLKLAQRDATSGVVRVSGQQQSPARRPVSARKVFQLLIETLEAQAEAQRTAIFEEKASRLFDVFGERGLKQIDLV